VHSSGPLGTEGHQLPHRETYRNTLRYALAIVGSDLALSVRLKVPVAILKNWLDGVEPMPDAAFLHVVDLIVATTPDEIARTRDVRLKPEQGVNDAKQ